MSLENDAPNVDLNFQNWSYIHKLQAMRATNEKKNKSTVIYQNLCLILPSIRLKVAKYVSWVTKITK